MVDVIGVVRIIIKGYKMNKCEDCCYCIVDKCIESDYGETLLPNDKDNTNCKFFKRKLIKFHKCLMRHEYFGFKFITATFYQYGGEAELMETQRLGVGCTWIKFVGEPIKVEEDEKDDNMV